MDRVLKNYRLVNNLSFMSKIIEKVMLLRFNNHCEMNNLTPDYVSAYRSRYSTETVLLRLTDKILQNMDRQCITPLVAVDLSTAFDTVEHRILKGVLHRKYSVTGTALKWYVSYLENRKVKVQINKSTSGVLEITTSVPKGTVSGPVLYNCYANTLKDYLEESCNHSINLLGYADDLAIYSQFRTGLTSKEINCQHHLEKVLAEIKIWMNRNFMKMNDAKTEYTKFGNKRQLSKCTRNDIQVGDFTVQASLGLNYLGLFMDEELTFKKHTQNKSRVASRNLFNLRKLRRHVSRESIEILVYGLVMSYLDYSNGVLGLLPNPSLKPY